MVHPKVEEFTKKVDGFMAKYPTISQQGKRAPGRRAVLRLRELYV
jgi:hypothetical protein